jgi:AcrR family transcriptional regulator
MSMIAPSAKTAVTGGEGDPSPRGRILVAARASFYRRGIHGANAEAGTNKMTLYWRLTGMLEVLPRGERPAKGPLVASDAAR